MAVEISTKDDKNRIDHPVYDDVYNVTYKKAVVEDFETEDTSIGMGLTGMVMVEGDWVSVFYTCKRYCYNENTGSLQENESLIDGVNSFQVGDEVILLEEKGKPKFVIGHIETENHMPKMCADIFKMTFTGWDKVDYFIYYQGTAQDEMGGLNCIPSDHYGNDPVCDQEGLRLFGQSEFQRGTLMYFWGDILVKVGPVFYIIRIQSIGLPAPITAPFVVFKAVWSEELEAQCVTIGDNAESGLHQGIFDPLPPLPVYPAGVEKINKLATVLSDRFSGSWGKLPAPRWFYTKLYGQSYYE